VIVVGGGAAGIGAARRLCESGRSVLVLEARERTGGRAHTWQSADGLRVDLGAAWLHSADTNPLVGLARDAQQPVDETKYELRSSVNERQMGPERLAAWQAYRAAFDREVDRCGELGKDVACDECAGPDATWYALLDAHIRGVAGAPLHAISALDFSRYQGSEIDWRLPHGYGALLESLARPLPVRTSAPVMRIDAKGHDISVGGSWGSLSSRRVVITLPTSLLADESIRFEPRLPPAKLAAAAGLPLGAVGKLFLRIDGGALRDCRGDFFTGEIGEPDTGFYVVRPFGQPIVEAYSGGSLHEDLERAGPEAWTCYAVEQLVGLFGTDLRGLLSRIHASGWLGDRWTRGGYSNAAPGAADARSQLARPVEDRLFFAGEATSPDHMATVHGAYLSGQRAADEAVASLGPTRAGD